MTENMRVIGNLESDTVQPISAFKIRYSHDPIFETSELASKTPYPRPQLSTPETDALPLPERLRTYVHAFKKGCCFTRVDPKFKPEDCRDCAHFFKSTVKNAVPLWYLPEALVLLHIFGCSMVLIRMLDPAWEAPLDLPVELLNGKQ
jgi:hypothetical protein